MAREGVAMDFLGLGLGEPSSDGEHGTLVRPTASVPDSNLAMGSISRRSPAAESGRAADRDNNSRLRHGMHRPSWKKQGMNVHQAMAGKHPADVRNDEDNSGKMDVSPKREMSEGPPLGHSPSLSAWDHSASPPATNSPNRYQELALAHQARMRAAVMYANGLQAPRSVHNTVSQTSSHGDEAHKGAQPSERAGPEQLSMSISAGQQHPQSGHTTVFGSPLPPHNRKKGSDGAENGFTMAGHRLPQMQHIGQGASVQGHTLARPAQAAGIGKHPRTAQLTIFYAGMVNVYDDVPFDKAQAIMLLAGSGNTGSAPPGLGASGRPFSAPMAVPQSAPSSPALTTAPSATPTQGPSFQGLITNVLRQPIAARNANIELPQARKASLARFLEKRKDRVRKGPYPVKREGSVTPPRDKSPSPSSTKPPTRSPSPTSTTGTHRQQLSSPGRGHQPSVSSGSEPTSPTRSPQTPPRESIPDEKSNGVTGGREYEKDREASVMHRGRSPQRSRVTVESRVDVMDDDMS